MIQLKNWKKVFLKRRHTNDQQVYIWEALNITNYQGNANLNHNKVSPHTHYNWLVSKRWKIASIGKDVEKRKTLHSTGESVNLCSYYGKQYKTQNRNTIWSNYPTTENISKGNEIRLSKRYLHNHAHYSVLPRYGINPNICQHERRWRRKIYNRQWHTILPVKRRKSWGQYCAIVG